MEVFAATPTNVTRTAGKVTVKQGQWAELIVAATPFGGGATTVYFDQQLPSCSLGAQANVATSTGSGKFTCKGDDFAGTFSADAIANLEAVLPAHFKFAQLHVDSKQKKWSFSFDCSGPIE
ncbi:MAG TPA: hypothetical protein VMR50_15180 [Myxococcota bacterium]|nr:hypothetical protein [Myxococcota bacterium]